MAFPEIKGRVAIVGGGFAGVYAARSLERVARKNPGLSITLISRENYFLMTPLLFEAGTGVLEPRHAVCPIRKMIRTTRFVQGTAEQIDLDKRSIAIRVVHQDDLQQLEFDHLVLALGGVTNTRLIPGSEKVRTFKTLRDAIMIRNHCIRMFEQADAEASGGGDPKTLTFVIIGGGLVGLELQGELTEFIKNIRGTYPSVDEKRIRLELIEAGPRLMPELDAPMGEYALKTLRRRGVNIRLNMKVSQIEDSRVTLADGTVIEAGTIILAAGVAPNPLIGTLPIEKNEKGRVAVNATMQSRSHPNVWALGDCAAIPDPDGKPYPQLAQHALREARLVGKNIGAVMAGQQPRPFTYKNKGTLAALGHYQGVGKVYKIRIFGPLAWWVWRTYYLMQMPHFSRKLRLAIDWTIAFFFKNDVVELDVTARQ